MATLSPASEAAIRRLIEDLVAGNFDALESDGRIGRLTPADVRPAIADYGKTLVPVPDRLVVEVYPSDTDSMRSAVDVALWTKEEGRSDLTLSLTLIVDGEGATVTIDDLHVL